MHIKNSKIKKKIGEIAYQFLIRNFNEDYLAEELPKIFVCLSDIRNIKEEELFKLKIILNEKQIEPNNTENKKTAKELLNEAGFILYDNIKSKKEYLTFKKHFKEDEKLCKFESYDATKRYSKLFWIVRKDVQDILRLDNPSRQDLYSTSSMSVGISEDKKNVLQITSRYNHTVSACDNTYNSNLDDIVEGLTNAFNVDYELQIKKTNQTEFTNFSSIDNKYYHYNREIDGIKYGINIVDGKYYDPANFLIFDNFILDFQEKKLRILDDQKDYLVTFVNEHEDNIKFSFCKNELKIITNSATLNITLNQDRKIISFSSDELTTIGNYFLYCNISLISISLPNNTTIGNDFLYCNKVLTSISLPNNITIGDDFLYHNQVLTSISLPNNTTIDNNFLYHNQVLESTNLPNNITIGNDFLYCNKVLESISLPNNTTIANYFLYYNQVLESTNLPNNITIGDDFLYCNQVLESISLLNNTTIGNDFLYCNKVLESISLPNNTTIANYFLYYNKLLESISLPNNTTIGNNFLYYNKLLESISLPNNTTIGNNFLYHNQVLTSISVPNNTTIGNNFLCHNKLLIKSSNSKTIKL